jgi:ATP-dependent Clp protease ATP-binding subunit ClpA
LRVAFRPEFTNRLGEIVIFNPMGKGQLENIVALRPLNDRNGKNEAMKFESIAAKKPAAAAVTS